MAIHEIHIMRLFRESLRLRKPRFVLLALALSVLLFGLIYPHESFAGIGGLFNPLGSIVDALGSALGNAIAAIIIGLASGLLGMSTILLEWAIDPWFVKYGYTTGTIIDIGWPVVRDLANMMLVLALIAIGIGTALRISGYEIKKALPRFLAVALLINFTPVILGVLVDAANIVMNFFLEGFIGASAIKNTFTNFFNGMSTKNIFTPAFWLELTMILQFSLLAFVLFLIYAILFVMRRVTIWILVILSPLAFVAWIFPATKSYFNKWWGQFVQWTVIGIPAAFFLWLGNQVIALAGQADFSADVGGVEGFLQETFNQIAAYAVAIIFLIVGFFMTLQTSAIGAAGVIAGGQMAGRLASIRYLQTTGRGIGAIGKRGGQAVKNATTRAQVGWQTGTGLRGKITGAFGEATAPIRGLAGRTIGGPQLRAGWQTGKAAGRIFPVGEAVTEWWRGVRGTVPGVPGLIPNLWQRAQTGIATTAPHIASAGQGINFALRDILKQSWTATLAGYGWKTKKQKGEACPRCGQSIKGGWNICPNCGTSLPPQKQCPTCGRTTPRRAKICPFCGTKLP